MQVRITKTKDGGYFYKLTKKGHPITQGTVRTTDTLGKRISAAVEVLLPKEG